MQAALMLTWGSLVCKNAMVVILVLTLAHGSCIGKAASHDSVYIGRTLTGIDPISATAGGIDYFALQSCELVELTFFCALLRIRHLSLRRLGLMDWYMLTNMKVTALGNAYPRDCHDHKGSEDNKSRNNYPQLKQER